eukprot:6640977-Prymnesium_polylepis.1
MANLNRTSSPPAPAAVIANIADALWDKIGIRHQHSPAPQLSLSSGLARLETGMPDGHPRRPVRLGRLNARASYSGRVDQAPPMPLDCLCDGKVQDECRCQCGGICSPADVLAKMSTGEFVDGQSDASYRRDSPDSDSQARLNPQAFDGMIESNLSPQLVGSSPTIKRHEHRPQHVRPARVSLVDAPSEQEESPEHGKRKLHFQA